MNFFLNIEPIRLARIVISKNCANGELILERSLMAINFQLFSRYALVFSDIDNDLKINAFLFDKLFKCKIITYVIRD